MASPGFSFTALQQAVRDLAAWRQRYKKHVELVPADLRNDDTFEMIGDEIDRLRVRATARRIYDTYYSNSTMPDVDTPGDSVPERLFFEACLESGHSLLTDLVLQHKIMIDDQRYRVDFALLVHRIVIEIDGLAYHSSQDAIIRDHRRQRALERDGWRVIRFAAKEVLDNPGACVRETVQSVNIITR